MKYRLATRGLVWGDPPPAKPASTTSISGLRNPLDEAALLRLQRLIVNLYQPSILETLSQLTPADMALWARTCPWMRRPRTRPALIRHPRALVPHLPLDDIPGNHPLAETITKIRTADRAGEEIRALSAGKMKRKFQTNIGGIAALSLFEFSRWGKRQREDIFEAALDTPETCYFFAASVTPTDDEWKRLISELVFSPRYLFFALRLPGFPCDPDLKSAMASVIAEDPLLNFAVNEPRGRVSLKKLDAFRSGELREPRQCLLALLIDPESDRAGEWVEVITQTPSLSYEAACLVRYSGHIPTGEKFRHQLRMGAFQDPRWSAHWIRDLGPEANEEAKDLVPHLEWVAELIEDGSCTLGIAHEIDQAASATMDDIHWLRSSFVLYCGEKKKNEA